MALKDYYNINDNSGNNAYGVSRFAGQTFTASSSYDITSVKLKLHRSGLPGTLTVEIQTTSGGLPTNTAVASGTTDGDTLPTATSGEWREITFAAPYSLVSSVKYAIVLKALSGTIVKSVYWRHHSTSPAYSGGAYVITTNGGSSWSEDTGIDRMFETYDATSGVAYDEGVLEVSAAATFELTTEIFTELDYDEGVLEVSAAGTFVMAKESFRDISGFPPSRVSDYDPDLIWDEETGTWLETLRPGFDKIQYLVAVGEQGDICFSRL